MFCTIVLGAASAASSRAEHSAFDIRQSKAPKTSFACFKLFAPGIGIVSWHRHQLIATYSKNNRLLDTCLTLTHLKENSLWPKQILPGEEGQREDYETQTMYEREHLEILLLDLGLHIIGSNFISLAISRELSLTDCLSGQNGGKRKCLTCGTVFFLVLATRRISPMRGCMPGRICLKSKPLGPDGRLSWPASYFPVSRPSPSGE